MYVTEDEPLLAARANADDLGGTEPVPPEVGAALRFLACAVGARTAVEIGTGCGSSGIWLLRGMRPGSTLTSVDTEPEYHRLARKAFAQAGFAPNQARLILGRALDVLPRLSDGTYDMVFCDADVRDYPDYLAAALRLLRPGGIVAFNNSSPDARPGRCGSGQPGAGRRPPRPCSAAAGRWPARRGQAGRAIGVQPTTDSSTNYGQQGVAKLSRLISRQLNNQPTAAFKRDAHHDTAPLLGDLKRTVARPRLHRRHFPSPSSGPHTVLTRPSAALLTPDPAPAAEPASNNRFYRSPYYPVFGSRMVMIGQARRRRARPRFLLLRFARRYPQEVRTPAARRES